MKTIVIACFVGALASSSWAQGAESTSRVALGAQTALAHEQGNLFGSGPSGNMSLTFVQGQIFLTVLQSGSAPRLQMINELVLGQSFGPSKGLLVGLDETFRVHLRPEERVGWYIEAGAGISSIAFSARNLDGKFQFLLHVGTGVRLHVGRGSLTLGYRLSHLSNNGTIMPNLGLNMHTAVVGFSVSL